jgi:hypothetical protein
MEPVDGTDPLHGWVLSSESLPASGQHVLFLTKVHRGSRYCFGCWNGLFLEDAFYPDADEMEMSPAEAPFWRPAPPDPMGPDGLPLRLLRKR